jgi:hypothetical protein
MGSARIGHPIRSMFSVLRRLSLRKKIAASILFAFVIALPAAGLSLIYLSDLLSSVKILTERDARLGRSAADLSSVMLDIQHHERNYRLFGVPADHDAIVRLIGGADSILTFIQTIAPLTERDTLDEIVRSLHEYSAYFDSLTSLVSENQSENRSREYFGKPGDDSGGFEAIHRGLIIRIRNAPPALRDSLLDEAVREIDGLSLDRITGPGVRSGKKAAKALLLRNLDASSRDFIAAAHRFAETNWRLLEEHKEESIRIEARAKRNIIFVLILTVVVCGFMVVLLPRRVVKPIALLNTMVRKTGNGNRELETSVFPHDEIGDLAAAYAALVDKTRHMDDLKTKRIASQKRFIDRLLDYLDVPVCILTKQFSALYMNPLFTRMFGPAVQQKIPEGGIDLTTIPAMIPFIDAIRKEGAQAPGDFTFSFDIPGRGETVFRVRPVRNAALTLETIIIIGEPASPRKG